MLAASRDNPSASPGARILSFEATDDAPNSTGVERPSVVYLPREYPVESSVVIGRRAEVDGRVCEVTGR